VLVDYQSEAHVEFAEQSKQIAASPPGCAGQIGPQIEWNENELIEDAFCSKARVQRLVRQNSSIDKECTIVETSNSVVDELRNRKAALI
jgi:hypothetical protein